MTSTNEILRKHQTVQAAVHDQAPLLRLARESHQSRRGSPVLFADKPSLPALYEALPKLEGADVRKAGQTGLTELLIQLMIYEAGHRGRICAYVLPTEKKSQSFVADRIDRLFEEVPDYRLLLPFGNSDRRRPDSGNLSRKRVGKGTLLFFGAETNNNWTEWSADTLVVDEYDDCDEGNVALGPDRLTAAQGGEARLIHVSNPTRGPGLGIDRKWGQGSRGAWYQRCTRCGFRQVIDWFAHIVERDDFGRWVPRDRARAGQDGHLLGDLRPVCARCRAPFERAAEGGVWAHERAPVGGVRATFTMSWLDGLPNRPGHQIYRDLYARFVAAQGNDAELVAFFVMKLGQGKKPQGGSLDATLLEAAAAGNPPIDHTGATTPGRAIVMGSDIGGTFHTTVAELIPDLGVPEGARRRKLWVGTTRSWGELESLRRRYHPGIVVVDNGPETTAARDWCAAAEEESRREADRKEGPVCYAFRCAFHASSRAAGSDLALSLDTSARLATVDRTQLLDRAWYDLRDGLCKLPGDVLAVPHFRDQMCEPVRVVNESTGVASWTKGVDHFRLADGYERVALALAGVFGCGKVPDRA